MTTTNHDHVLIVGANQPYLPYLNSFLNSLHKQLAGKAIFDIKVIWNGEANEKYFKACQDSMDLDIEFVIVNEELMDRILPDTCSKAERCKASRYYYLEHSGHDYQTSCLMDADLMVVSPEFQNFFDMVKGSDTLIGCNEGFKWVIDPKTHLCNGKPMLPASHKLHKFHCNVPLFLDVGEWVGVIESYLAQVYRGEEVRAGKSKRIGDMYTWNIAVAQHNRESDVVLMPMEVMTQVHYTGFRDNTQLIKEGNYYHTKAGDPVYCLHGRPDKPAFRNMETAPGAMQKHGIEPGIFNKWAQLMEDEWLDCNFNQAVNLGDFVDANPYWGGMGKDNKIVAKMRDGTFARIVPDTAQVSYTQQNCKECGELGVSMERRPDGMARCKNGHAWQANLYKHLETVMTPLAIVDRITDEQLEELVDKKTVPNYNMHAPEEGNLEDVNNAKAKPKEIVEELGSKGITLGFGNGALGKGDWSLLRTSIMDLNVATFLEIGAGYSTVLIGGEVEQLVSLEFNQSWINMVNISKNDNTMIYKVEYPEIEIPFQPTVKYDMAFVDGPASSQTYEGRKHSMYLAAKHSDRVWCHDAGRPMETAAIKEVFVDRGWVMTRGSGGMQMWERTSDQQ